jgi:hypothetical protein
MVMQNEITSFILLKIIVAGAGLRSLPAVVISAI